MKLPTWGASYACTLDTAPRHHNYTTQGMLLAAGKKPLIG